MRRVRGNSSACSAGAVRYSFGKAGRGMSNRLQPEITPELLLKAYAAGIFPMAESADDTTLHWVEPHMRGILPLDALRTTRKLRALIKSGYFKVTADRDFAAVISACAEPGEGRATTWISQRIQKLYTALYEEGHAHSIEVWREGSLAGGLYGVSLGAAFFGESMFHRETDASKVALTYLVARLRIGGYALLDTQFVTPHLLSLGAVEIPRERYNRQLAAAIRRDGDFGKADRDSVFGDAEVLAELSSA
jgi:leucyl/phenylalanyl-tRNA---protein transferase